MARLTNDEVRAEFEQRKITFPQVADDPKHGNDVHASSASTILFSAHGHRFRASLTEHRDTGYARQYGRWTISLHEELPDQGRKPPQDRRESRGTHQGFATQDEAIRWAVDCLNDW